MAAKTKGFGRGAARTPVSQISTKDLQENLSRMSGTDKLNTINELTRRGL